MMSDAEKNFYNGKILELDLEIKRLDEENKQLRNFISTNLIEGDIRVDNILTSDLLSDSTWFKGGRCFYISKPFTAEMVNKFITNEGTIQVSFNGNIQFYKLITNDDVDMQGSLTDPNCLHIILIDHDMERFTVLKDNCKVLENYFNYF